MYPCCTGFDAAHLLVLQEPALVQEISEVPGPFPLVRGLQPMDVEQVLDVTTTSSTSRSWSRSCRSR